MANLLSTSHKDLDIGQKLYIIEECGIDCSYFIEPWSLTEFVVSTEGIGCIKVKRGNNICFYDRQCFSKIFTVKNDAIQYCEDAGIAYGFLIND